MTQEKLERMKASIKEAAEKRKALKEAGEMPLVNEAPTPVANDPMTDPAAAPAADVAPAAEPAAPAATPDSFTPPAPGMVPSGWVRPEDLASVVTAAQDEQDATAQATGDVEAAQSVEVPAAPAGSEIATPVVESILPKDGERKTPVSAEEEVAQEEELAKKKMKESEDEDEEAEDEESDEEEDDDEIPGEVEGDDEVVNDEDVDEVKDYFEPPVECDDCEEFEVVSDGDQMQADVLALTTNADGEEGEEEEEEIPSAEEIFDNSNFLDKLEAFFDDKDSEDVADLAAALHDSADFLDYLLGDSEEGEEEDTEELEESNEMNDEDRDGRIPFEKSHCEKPKHKDIRSRIEHRRAMSEAVKYPAGSEPEASQIANARRQQQVAEENLVKTYEEKVQARKDALRKVRENIKKSRNVNAAAEQAPGVFKESGRHSADRFKEAIRGRSNENRVSTKKTSSWEDNKFIDRYTERQKFNFRDLLNDGTITNLLG